MSTFSQSYGFSSGHVWMWELDCEEGWAPKNWCFQEYTELYKKQLHNQDNHDGVVTHLEPDILECEVKWDSESITTNKASGGDGIQLSYFKSWKTLDINYTKICKKQKTHVEAKQYLLNNQWITEEIKED